MWRVHSLLSRVINRFHKTNSPASLCVSTAPHGEGDCQHVAAVPGQTPLGNSSSFASRSQRGYDEGGKRRDTFFRTPCSHYTLWEAFGWGAAAVVFLQLAQRIHTRELQLITDGKEKNHGWSLSFSRILTPLYLHSGTWRQNILPYGEGAPDLGNKEQSSESTHSSDPIANCGFCDNSTQDEGAAGRTSEQEFLNGESIQCAGTSEKRTNQDLELDVEDAMDVLSKSASHLQKANESSVAVILNIMGLDYLKTGDHAAALSCFQVAADYGYCKAVYNAGVCYELGRGVMKDIRKASAYYRCAAEAGHSLAQYRYAKYLLSQKNERTVEDVNKAVELLQQSAKAGLPEAQAYLGVFYMKQPYRNDVKAVQYLQLAARSGDAASLYHLGLCYENGLGVQQNLQKALKLYHQAASSGCLKAQEALKVYCQKRLEGFVNCNQLKAVLSTPCLSSLERVAQQLNMPGMHLGIDETAGPMHNSSTALPHSWSTGNICKSPARFCFWDVIPDASTVEKNDHTAVAAQPLSCGWTVGIG